MNWADLIVIAIIAGFGIIGLTKGFIYSIFRLASFFASVIISIKFYPKVAEILLKTKMYSSIKNSIYKSLMQQQQVLVPQVNGQAKQAAADSIINNLRLPGFFKNILVNRMPDPSGLVDIPRVMDLVSDELAKVVIAIVSLVLLYILVRVGLTFLKFILKGIAKLPVFKQMDKLGGFIFGAVEGLLSIYILCTLLMLFNSAPWFKPVFDSIENSTAARFFYQNNFIINWMFPG